MYDDHEYWMQIALEQASIAGQKDEVPVGAIIVYQNQIIGTGHNQPISACDPTAHAEIVAIRQAANYLGNYRLNNADLYVTLEPCLMCLGAIIHARINQLIFGAHDPKTGVIDSQAQLHQTEFLNHRIKTQGNICASQSQTLLKNFFKAKRQKKR